MVRSNGSLVAAAAAAAPRSKRSTTPPPAAAVVRDPAPSRPARRRAAWLAGFPPGVHSESSGSSHRGLGEVAVLLRNDDDGADVVEALETGLRVTPLIEVSTGTADEPAPPDPASSDDSRNRNQTNAGKRGSNHSKGNQIPGGLSASEKKISAAGILSGQKGNTH